MLLEKKMEDKTEKREKKMENVVRMTEDPEGIMMIDPEDPEKREMRHQENELPLKPKSLLCPIKKTES